MAIWACWIIPHGFCFLDHLNFQLMWDVDMFTKHLFVYPMAAEMVIYERMNLKCPLGHLRFNLLRPRQNGRHFADDTFKYIFLNETVIISAKVSLKFVPKGPINNIPALVQIMAWRRLGDKPLSEPMMVRLPTHICVIRPQWVKRSLYFKYWSDAF